jgi:hypothetical protein
MPLYTVVRKSRSQPQQVQASSCERDGDVYRFWATRRVGGAIVAHTVDVQVPANDVVSIDPAPRSAMERSP